MAHVPVANGGWEITDIAIVIGHILQYIRCLLPHVKQHTDHCNMEVCMSNMQELANHIRHYFNRLYIACIACTVLQKLEQVFIINIHTQLQIPYITQQNSHRARITSNLSFWMDHLTDLSSSYKST